MKKQFAESYYGSDYPSSRINQRIEEGCVVLSAFGDAHYCTVVYEYCDLIYMNIGYSFGGDEWVLY